MSQICKQNLIPQYPFISLDCSGEEHLLSLCERCCSHTEEPFEGEEHRRCETGGVLTMHLLLLCPNPWSIKTIPGFSSKKSLKDVILTKWATLQDSVTSSRMSLSSLWFYSLCLNFPIMSSCTDRKRSKGWRYNKQRDKSSTLCSPNRCSELQSPSLPLATHAEDHGKPLERPTLADTCFSKGDNDSWHVLY